jgi:hypothetical protein
MPPRKQKKAPRRRQPARPALEDGYDAYFSGDDEYDDSMDIDERRDEAGVLDWASRFAGKHKRILGTIAGVGGALLLLNRAADAGYLTGENITTGLNTIVPGTGDAVANLGGRVKEAIVGDVRDQLGEVTNIAGHNFNVQAAQIGEIANMAQQANTNNQTLLNIMATMFGQEAVAAAWQQLGQAEAGLAEANPVDDEL